jgi:hypothetical protein
MLVGGLRSGLAGIALIDVGQLHVLFANLLHLGGEPFHVCAILLVGAGRMQRQQVPQRIDRRVNL